MSIPIFQVDAFTNQPFKGNPAGVCLLEAPQPDEWMLGIAREMNLSETAFLLPEGSAYRLRWFTPAVEVSLCGHATLASAHILWEQGCLRADQSAVFHTLSGELTAMRTADGWIALDFPARFSQLVEAPEDMLAALGLDEPLFVGKYREDYLVEVGDEKIVRALRPDFNRLLSVQTRGVVVTARSEKPPYDFLSRFFAPAVGVNEDPVTGSAHCALTPYWASRLGKQSMLAYQASQRGGELRVRLQGERVILEGQALTIFSGLLLV